MKILLLDMDGVLLKPHGYHLALQETVALVGRVLGYEAVHLTPEDIAAFEAAGVSSEWDSAAICAALLLENLWSDYPALTLPSKLSLRTQPTRSSTPPDFQAFTHLLAQTHLQEMPPLKRAEHLLMRPAENQTNRQNQAIQTILRKARQIDGSLTHRLFQELVLGSQVFAETFGLPPTLDTESYLLQHDRPTLSSSMRSRLLQWLQDVKHQAVIFTSRPSRPPIGHLCTPEAEIGAQGVGLETLPILGLGGISWLGARCDCDPQTFLKPSAAHSLAALRLALGDPLEGALEATAALVLLGQADSTWKALRKAQVCVFEDTSPGLQSIRAAKDILEEIEVPIRIDLFGITDNEPKRRALEATGAVVFPTLSAALHQVRGL